MIHPLSRSLNTKRSGGTASVTVSFTWVSNAVLLCPGANSRSNWRDILASTICISVIANLLPGHDKGPVDVRNDWPGCRYKAQPTDAEWKKCSFAMHFRVLIYPPFRSEFIGVSKVPLVSLDRMLRYCDYDISRNPDLVDLEAFRRGYPRLSARRCWLEA